MNLPIIGYGIVLMVIALGQMIVWQNVRSRPGRIRTIIGTGLLQTALWVAPAPGSEPADQIASFAMGVVGLIGLGLIGSGIDAANRRRPNVDPRTTPV